MSGRIVAVVGLMAVRLAFPFAVAAQSGDGDRRNTPRTPWGEPDLQGLWTSATLTPLERPERQAAVDALTDEEAGELEQRSAENRAASDGKSAPGSVGGCNQVWLDAGTRVTDSRRTSLIVDPPEGVIPWVAGAEAVSNRERARYGVGPFDSYTDSDTGERCITDGLPNMVPLQPYNMNMQILQTPGQVVMLHEMYHELRVIPLDDRPLTGIGQWTGEARGRWDGDTLVVNAEGFNGESWFDRAGNHASYALQVEERYTPMGPNVIMYEATMEDANTFTRPWTIRLPLYRRLDENAQVLEFKCVEFTEDLIYGHLRKEPTR